MAKILVSCAAVDGHMNPFINVVLHLIKCGHEIVWISGRAYREKVEATGARFAPMPLDFDANGLPVYEFKPELKKLKGINQIKFYVKTWCYDMVAPTMALIDEIRQNFEPDLYLSDPMVYGLYFKAELLDKPSINLHVLPLTLSSKDHGPFGTGLSPTKNGWRKMRIRTMNLLVNNLIFRDLKKQCDVLRESFGLSPYDHIFNGFLKSASKVLTVSVPGFDYERSDLPKNIEYIGPILPKAHKKYLPPDWWSELKGDRSVVLVNQGTIANDISELILPTVEALKNENVLVIAVPVDQTIENLPSNVRVAKFIPFPNLLPFVDVMVTNGGFGATHMALAQGIPLAVSGGSEDKMEVAARVAFSGCGINLKSLKPSAKNIKKAVLEILGDPKYKYQAKRLQKEISKYDPLKQIALSIEDLT